MSDGKLRKIANKYEIVKIIVRNETPNNKSRMSVASESIKERMEINPGASYKPVTKCKTV